MTKAVAIKLHCLICSGLSHKEVSLCHNLDCQLWSYRFGYSMRDKRFWKRMETARKNFPKDFAELLELVPDYLKILPKTQETALISEFYSRARQFESLSSQQTTSNQKRGSSVHNKSRMKNIRRCIK